jgi:hypothetical protein
LRGRMGRQGVEWQVGWLEAKDRDWLPAFTQMKQETARKATQDLVRTGVGRCEGEVTGRSQDKNK